MPGGVHDPQPRPEASQARPTVRSACRQTSPMPAWTRPSSQQVYFRQFEVYLLCILCVFFHNTLQYMYFRCIPEDYIHNTSKLHVKYTRNTSQYIGRPNTFFSCKTKLPRSRPSACRGFRNRFVLEETAEVKRWRVPMARDRSRESVHERYWSPSRAAVARHTAQLGHSRACRSKARLTGRNMRSLQPFGASGTG